VSFVNNKFFSLLLVSALALSGCSAPQETSTSNPSSSATATDGENSTGEPNGGESGETAEPEPTADPAYVFERYSQIAGRSCLKALDEGVIEQSADGLIKLIMVPKDQAYLGYSAVYIEQFGDQVTDRYVELLYDSSYFSSCTDYFDMELAQEAGAEFEYVEIKEDLPNATYEVTREFDGEQYTMAYEVIGGVITSSERVIQDSIRLDITYGITDAELALLAEAVDGYLESE
jgi:hypothetical protein